MRTLRHDDVRRRSGGAIWRCGGSGRSGPRLQELRPCRRRRSGFGPARRLAIRRERKISCPAWAVRMRKDHPAATCGRPDPARQRNGARIWCAPPTWSGHRLCVPVLSAHSLGQGYSKRGFLSARSRADRRGTGRADAPSHQDGGVDSLCQCLSGNVVRRHEAAGGFGARIGAGTQGPVDGRALCQHRRADSRIDANRTDAHMDPPPPSRAVRDPQR